jgi:LysR family transcriptional regulator, cyn operon transcriptional activator
MELRDLEYYLACVELGSVTAAARRVHVAQPTLSHALARLERELGECLIERKPRSALRVTAAGELLAARARTALGALKAFEFDLSQLKGHVRGQLRIASIQSLNATLLPQVLVRFLQKYPDVRVEAHTVAAQDIAQRIRDAQQDVGILASPVRATATPSPTSRSSALVHRALYRERFSVVVPQAHPFAKRRSVSLASLADERLVLAPASSFTGAVIGDAFAQVGVVPKVVMAIASTEALCEAVRRGVGITVLPDGYQVRSAYRLRSIPLRDPTPMRDVGLVMLGDEHATPAARAFRALIWEETAVQRARRSA